MNTRNRNAHAGIDLVAYWLAQALASDTVRFDRERFLTACGVTS